ncbi:hypothetical protein EAS64_36795 [Trebonia kvetii]|uniref:Uncharacterized protein n=1 Tax=Trebonia kvetii TaxID=2480626 RepID=A0A6P2BMN0_9ACTN|nr:hypothetical protein EAS64_36795 [Trebonia kvetii]
MPERHLDHRRERLRQRPSVVHRGRDDARHLVEGRAERGVQLRQVEQQVGLELALGRPDLVDGAGGDRGDPPVEFAGRELRADDHVRPGGDLGQLHVREGRGDRGVAAVRHPLAHQLGRGAQHQRARFRS